MMNLGHLFVSNSIDTKRITTNDGNQSSDASKVSDAKPMSFLDILSSITTQTSQKDNTSEEIITSNLHSDLNNFKDPVINAEENSMPIVSSEVIQGDGISLNTTENILTNSSLVNNNTPKVMTFESVEHPLSAKAILSDKIDVISNVVDSQKTMSILPQQTVIPIPEIVTQNLSVQEAIQQLINPESRPDQQKIEYAYQTLLEKKEDNIPLSHTAFFKPADKLMAIAVDMVLKQDVEHSKKITTPSKNDNIFVKALITETIKDGIKEHDKPLLKEFNKEMDVLHSENNVNNIPNTHLIQQPMTQISLKETAQHEIQKYLTKSLDDYINPQLL